MRNKPLNVLAGEIGPVEKILRLAWPVVVSMLLHNSYSIIDMFWVASLGKEFVAAVTLSGILIFGMFALSQIFATGVHALVARACGAGLSQRAGMMLRDGLLAAVLGGAAVGIVLGCFPAAALRLLGAEQEVVEIGIPYVIIMAAGFVISVPQFTLNAGYRATGDMKTAMLLTGITVALNIVFDPLLIFGLGPIPGFGLAGAAYATVFSLLCAFIVGLGFLRRHHTLYDCRFYTQISARTIREIFVIGLPAGAHYVLLSLTQTAMIRMVSEFGTVAVAATGIGTRITQLAFLPCMGIGAATATLVGQYLGAKRKHDAVLHVNRALQINAVVTGGICLLIALFADLLIGIFTDEPSVIETGTVFLRVFAASFIIVSTVIVLTRVFQGAGDTLWPALTVCVRLGGFLVIGYVLGWLTNLDELGIWMAFAAAGFLQLLVLSWIYRQGTWQRRELGSVQT